jgi:RND family efflux transporter MFP subunit
MTRQPRPSFTRRLLGTSRLLLAAAAAVALASLLALAGCGPRGGHRAESDAATPRSVTVVRVETGAQGGMLVLPARVTAREEVTITARLRGRLTELPFEEGRSFAAGATLARFDAPETRDAVAAAAARVEAARIRLETARRQEVRLDSLHALRAAALRELEVAREERHAADAASAEARAALADLRAGSDVTAPFAGVVVRHHVDVGATVAPGQALIDIRSTAAGEILAAVPEAAATSLHDARAEFQAGDGAWRPAVLVKVDGMTDFTTRTRNAWFRSVVPGTRLEPGAFARVRISGLAATPVPAGPGGNDDSTSSLPNVPTRCLVRRGGLTGVFVVREGHALLRWLRLGRETGDSVEVLAGLSPGDDVVIDPGDLEDGAAVTVTAR